MSAPAVMAAREAIRSDSRLENSDKLILIELAWTLRPEASGWLLRIKGLARQLSMAVTTVRASVRRLVRLGYLAPAGNEYHPGPSISPDGGVDQGDSPSQRDRSPSAEGVAPRSPGGSATLPQRVAPRSPFKEKDLKGRQRSPDRAARSASSRIETTRAALPSEVFDLYRLEASPGQSVSEWLAQKAPQGTGQRAVA